MGARLRSGLTLTTQYPTHLGAARALPIRPDLVIHPTGRPKAPLYVADLKYKLTEDMGVVGDHYQLLAYTTVLGLQEGALIYCQPPERAAGDVELETVRSLQVLGRQSHHYVYRFDLSGTRQEIATRLDDLAAWLSLRLARQRTPG